ncbi:MAG: dTMP kinase [Alphaproteobacteria bacterium]|nr:dTMP kinase [Alphaproteobacteria bacterium]MCZ6814547.1 dTMP kinase [Alphaproteobacteria bacterium]
MNQRQRGKFITLEGGEGVGKSTQSKRLAEFLEDRGITVMLTREPGGSDGGEQIRRLLVSGAPGRWTPLTEAFLYAAARADHVAHLIEPALAEGRWVISDRFTDSTLAYQGFGHGLPLDAVTQLNALAAGELKPDLTFILDVPVGDGLARARARPDHRDEAAREDRYERMDEIFHQRVAEGYLTIARSEPERCIVVDTTGPVDQVARVISATVGERLLKP